MGEKYKALETDEQSCTKTPACDVQDYDLSSYFLDVNNFPVENHEAAEKRNKLYCNESGYDSLDICAHYSLKFQYVKNFSNSYERFINFYQSAQIKGDISEILLVNGSGPKRE